MRARPVRFSRAIKRSIARSGNRTGKGDARRASRQRTGAPSMSLIQIIVSRYGGRLACDRQSGAIPAPGHSKRDRSVSLRLNADGKLLIHCFSDTDWRDVKAAFLRDGIAGEGDFVGNSPRTTVPETHHQGGAARQRSMQTKPTSLRTISKNVQKSVINVS